MGPIPARMAYVFDPLMEHVAGTLAQLCRAGCFWPSNILSHRRRTPEHAQNCRSGIRQMTTLDRGLPRQIACPGEVEEISVVTLRNYRRASSPPDS